jgi:hypothetical protein
MKVEAGTRRFTENTFADWQAVIVRLRDSDDALARHIRRDALKADTLLLLLDYDGKGPPSKDLVDHVLRDVNEEIIDKPDSLPLTALFPGNYRTKKTAPLLEKRKTTPLTPAEAQDLNRLLLEAAFERQIFRPWWRPAWRVGPIKLRHVVFAAAAILVAYPLYWLLTWHTPTRFRLTFYLDEVTVKAPKYTPSIIGRVPFRSLTVSNVTGLSMNVSSKGRVYIGQNQPRGSGYSAETFFQPVPARIPPKLLFQPIEDPTRLLKELANRPNTTDRSQDDPNRVELGYLSLPPDLAPAPQQAGSPGAAQQSAKPVVPSLSYREIGSAARPLGRTQSLAAPKDTLLHLSKDDQGSGIAKNVLIKATSAAGETKLLVEFQQRYEASTRNLKSDSLEKYYPRRPGQSTSILDNGGFTTYRVDPDKEAYPDEVSGGKGTTYALRCHPLTKFVIFSGVELPVDSFGPTDKSDQRVFKCDAINQVEYHKYKHDPLKLGNQTELFLANPRNRVIREISWDPDRQAFKVQADVTVDMLRSDSDNRDYTLLTVEQWWYRSQDTLLVTILATALAILTQAVKFLRTLFTRPAE